jgi:outer membrane lipoprotein SlyB
MKSLAILAAATVSAIALGGCASDQYASACQRDYANNRAAATVAGAAVGAAAGVAIAKDDAAGALIGGAAGGVIGNQLAKNDDPCGYRRGYRDGYDRDRRDRDRY